MAEHPKPHDEAPSVIVDHAFEPRDMWWSLCKHCGLAQAAHSESTIDTVQEISAEHMEKYGEIRHVDPNRKADLERQFREFDRKHRHPGGRVQIGTYVGDEPDD